jgi:hypothetical protein
MIKKIKDYISAYLANDNSLKIANSKYLIRRLIKKNPQNKELITDLYIILRELK